eukprot:14303651-Alexandrium_andersonii.AAC.1
MIGPTIVWVASGHRSPPTTLTLQPSLDGARAKLHCADPNEAWAPSLKSPRGAESRWDRNVQ